MRLFIFAALLVVGCSSPHATQPGEPGSSVKPATEVQVRACTYLDDVTGTSAHYGAFAGRGITNSREEATARAASLGATHIVWSPASSGYGSTTVSGKAYRCS